MSNRFDHDDACYFLISAIASGIIAILLGVAATGHADDEYRRGVIEAQTGDAYVEQIGTKHGGPVWGPVVRKEGEE